MCVGMYSALFGDGLGGFAANVLDGSGAKPEKGKNCHQPFLNSFFNPYE